MTPKQAAAVIGCTVGQVRTLIRSGRIKARREPTPGWGPGYFYDISPAEARRYRDTEQIGGFPRGQRRRLPTNLRRRAMYTIINFKSKKELRDAVKRGDVVKLYAPGLGEPARDGREFVEGPHYPEPHRWYAEVTMQDGLVVKVK